MAAGAGGAGSTADNGAAGGVASLTAGVGGVGDTAKVGGTGGNLTLAAGAGGAANGGTEGDGGDVTINAGDGATDGDISIGVTKAANITIGNSSSAVVLAGSSIDLSTDKLENFLVETTTDIDDRALADTESGGYFNNLADTDTSVFTLPAAVTGLRYTFTDQESGAGRDLIILANTGDKINNGTAAEYYNCYDDATGSTVTLVAADNTDWIVVAEKGTWVNDNDALDN